LFLETIRDVVDKATNDLSKFPDKVNKLIFDELGLEFSEKNLAELLSSCYAIGPIVFLLR